jgi:hypothetical protein
MFSTLYAVALGYAATPAYWSPEVHLSGPLTYYSVTAVDTSVRIPGFHLMRYVFSELNRQEPGLPTKSKHPSNFNTNSLKLMKTNIFRYTGYGDFIWAGADH